MDSTQDVQVFPVTYAPNKYEVRVTHDGQPTIWNSKTGRQISPAAYEKTGGYKVVTLYLQRTGKNGAKKVKRFCDIVCRAVYGHPPHNHTCDHTDGDTSNDNIANLRWATAAEQRANQRERLGRNSRVQGVIATEVDGTRTEYISRRDAAFQFIGDESDIKRIETYIGNAIRNQTPFKGRHWSNAPQNGDDVVEWRPVPAEALRGRETGHTVSACGLIKESKGRITVGYKSRQGYMMFAGCRVHRIVAMAWCEGRTEERNVVDHIDRNPINNRASNLRWVTPEENAQNAIQPNMEAIYQLSKDGCVLQQFDAMNFASAAMEIELGKPTTIRNIQHVVHGHQDSAYGYGWVAVNPEIAARAEETRNARLQLLGKRKPVWQVNRKTKKKIKQFDSMAEATRQVPGACKIGKCCRGERNTSGGFAWAYVIPEHTNRSGASTQSQRIAHIKDGIVVGLYESGVVAARELTNEWKIALSQSTISRNCKPGKHHLLFAKGTSKTVHSHLRLAEESDVVGDADGGNGRAVERA